MFVFFPARWRAGSACEKYEVIMLTSMVGGVAGIISHVLFHSANHSNTSVLTSWAESERVCLSFPLFVLPSLCLYFNSFFLLIPVLYAARHEIKTPMQPFSVFLWCARSFILAGHLSWISNKHGDKAVPFPPSHPHLLLATTWRRRRRPLALPSGKTRGEKPLSLPLMLSVTCFHSEATVERIWRKS